MSITHCRSHDTPRHSLPYPPLRYESDLEQIDDGCFERDGNAERHQVGGNQIPEVENQLENHMKIQFISI